MQSSQTSVNSLAGKTALVTGASRTLGAEIARRLARSGADVAINYHHSRDAALSLCNELRGLGVGAQAIGADVSQPTEVEDLVSQTLDSFGQIDVLVNNVGPYVDTPFIDLSLADFDAIWAGNVRATFMMSQSVGRQMRGRESGQIINIAATDFAHRSHSIYGLAKAGVIHLTQAMALELAPHVRVNALAPDLIADNEDMTEAITGPALAGTPQGRLVTRAEVAEMVCLLCGPAFEMMTGQTLVMDGGRTIPRIAEA
jgi:NAD(P)-dependent dehydrogenase (short-subunit alcohol dehydrogenase family)